MLLCTTIHEFLKPKIEFIQRQTKVFFEWSGPSKFWNVTNVRLLEDIHGGSVNEPRCCPLNCFVFKRSRAMIT